MSQQHRETNNHSHSHWTVGNTQRELTQSQGEHANSTHEGGDEPEPSCCTATV